MDATAIATQILESLQRQEALLQLLVESTNKPKLGLHSDIGRVFIYCNRIRNGSNWYTLDSSPDRNPVPVNASALTGYLTSVKFEKTERRGQETWKMLITLEADRTYVLESGHNTHFTKSFLAAIASLNPNQIHKPITIAPREGDDDSVLFCSVWCGDQYIRASYDQSTDWRAIANKVKALVNPQITQE